MNYEIIRVAVWLDWSLIVGGFVIATIREKDHGMRCERLDNISTGILTIGIVGALVLMTLIANSPAR